ncbi:response regulator transcription factor [Burkholderia ubonensis]|uniref:response regulator transcription factor n=1 Tax=Burkholderia ubonensis TaxID=101571 RepID=UPI000759C41D|nr:response regulator transcription factor [Burkholderia ubonensis]KWK83823.1 two-component system response regulator [Burkholderia ubonensis]
MRILMVEDDVVHAHTAEKVLQQLGHEIFKVEDGETAIRFLRSEAVDLVVLDWQLPRISGVQVLQWVRTHLGESPKILFLTAKALEVDTVCALDAGANDYVVKPFRAAEFSARVGALLRHTKPEVGGREVIRAGNYLVDLTSRTVQLNGRIVELTHMEYELVVFFFKNIGNIVSRDVLCVNTWGRALDASSTLNTHIYRIRQKLEMGPKNGLKLTSVYTQGYRLDEVSRTMEAELLAS